MPRNPSGVYSLPASYLAVAGDTIRTEQHNPPFEDVAQALTDSLPRSGVAPMTGNLAMGANKITGLAAGTNASDALRFDQRLGGSAWLLSVSALALAANEFVYATGVNTAAKATITAAGLALLDDADAAAQRTTLGLGSAAIADLTDDDDLSVDPDNLGTRGNMAAAATAAAAASTWTETTPVATTSGTAFDTTIPSGVTEIEVIFMNSGATGAVGFLVQMGSSSTPETTGYVSQSALTGSATRGNNTTGFFVYRSPGYNLSGTMNLKLFDGTSWVENHSIGSSTADVGMQGGGYKTFSAEVDILRLTNTTPAAFNSGQFKVRYR